MVNSAQKWSEIGKRGVEGPSIGAIGGDSILQKWIMVGLISHSDKRGAVTLNRATLQLRTDGLIPNNFDVRLEQTLCHVVHPEIIWR